MKPEFEFIALNPTPVSYAACEALRIPYCARPIIDARVKGSPETTPELLDSMWQKWLASRRPVPLLGG